MILHCMRKTDWEKIKNKAEWGGRNIEADGFIHCSSPELFWRVAPNFIKIQEELVLLYIDEARLKSEVRYEDSDNCGRAYPHVYGLINNDAVTDVLPFIKDENGNYVKNAELAHIEDK